MTTPSEDTLANVLEFIPLRELEDVACVGSLFRLAVRLRWARLKMTSFQNRAFVVPEEEPAPPSAAAVAAVAVAAAAARQRLRLASAGGGRVFFQIANSAKRVATGAAAEVEKEEEDHEDGVGNSGQSRRGAGGFFQITDSTVAVVAAAAAAAEEAERRSAGIDASGSSASSSSSSGPRPKRDKVEQNVAHNTSPTAASASASAGEVKEEEEELEDVSDHISSSMPRDGEGDHIFQGENGDGASKDDGAEEEEEEEGSDSVMAEWRQMADFEMEGGSSKEEAKQDVEAGGEGWEALNAAAIILRHAANGRIPFPSSTADGILENGDSSEGARKRDRIFLGNDENEIRGEGKMDEMVVSERKKKRLPSDENDEDFYDDKDIHLGRLGELLSEQQKQKKCHLRRPWGIERALFPVLITLEQLTLRACRLSALDFRTALQAMSRSLVSLTLAMCVIEDPTSVRFIFDAPHMAALKDLSLSPACFVWRDNLFVNAPNLRRLSSFRKMLEDCCSSCGRAQPSYKCSRCRFFAFCSEKCQRDDWDSPTGHKVVCSKAFRVSLAVEENPDCWLAPTIEISKNLEEICLAHYWKEGFLFSTSSSDTIHTPRGGSNGTMPLFPAPPKNSPVVAATAAATAVHEDDDDDSIIASQRNKFHLVITHDGTDSTSASQAFPKAAFSRQSIKLRMALSIRSLSLIRCGLLDSSLDVISRNGKALRFLDISYNSKITGIGLGYLKNSKCPYLRSLKLTQCYRLSDDSIRQLSSSLPALEELVCDAGFRRRRVQRHTEGVEFLWTINSETLKTLGRCRLIRRIVLLAPPIRPVTENGSNGEGNNSSVIVKLPVPHSNSLERAIEELRLANIEVVTRQL